LQCLGGEENTSIQLKQAIIMPVLGSVSLVVLFYFLNIIYWLLVVILGIAVFVSMIYVWQPIVDGIIKDILHREPTKKFKYALISLNIVFNDYFQHFDTLVRSNASFNIDCDDILANYGRNMDRNQ
jgi:hypothetical protein